MKFGLDYHSQLLPRWAEHYIDYNGLRLQLRLAYREGKDVSGFVNEYCNAVRSYESFLSARYEAFAQRVPDAEDGVDGKVNSGTLSDNSSHSMSDDGKTSLSEFQQLMWFRCVNGLAMTRLLVKLTASGQADSTLIEKARRQYDDTCDATAALTNAAARWGRVESPRGNENGAEEHAVDDLCRIDDEGLTPLDHAMLSRDADLFSRQLAALVDGRMENCTDVTLSVLLGRLLLMAVRMGDGVAADKVLKCRPDVGVESRRGESSLYCAAERGDVDMARRIVGYMREISDASGLDGAVRGTGWTALMAASARGHEAVVRCLVEAGADVKRVDHLGWTAREHAAYRGHLLVAATIGEAHQSCINQSGGPAQAVSNADGLESTLECSKLKAGQKALVVTLGSVQNGHERRTLRLRHRGVDVDGMGLCGLSLEVKVTGDVGGGVLERALPLLADEAVEPLVGLVEGGGDEPLRIEVRVWEDDVMTETKTETGTNTTKTETDGKIRRKTSNKSLVSAGVAILDREHHHARFGAGRESMLREVVVVMLDGKTMEFAGTVLLSYLVATPFEGLDGGCGEEVYRRRGTDMVRLVGHRGMGQNTAGVSNLQIGENTITSFLSAHRLGAPFVEFDVQLTRDLEAVIFHDFSFSGSGSDVPIHDISLAQYKYAGELQNPGGVSVGDGVGARPRASSSGEGSMLKALQARERLRHTVDFGGRGFKANTRGHSIQDAFATLEELLVNLPEEIGFDIEMKYQRLHEAIDAGVASVTIDINTFVDTALEKVRRLAGRRPIIFSSFTPDICVLLRLKQAAYPVLFITNAGKTPLADRERRAASLQTGLRFARRWRLAGMVVACDAFLACPRLVGRVRNGGGGMVCASYGVENNEPANARMQVDAGIDVLIVDKVRLIAEELAKGVEG